ncbi:C40 family peptidase [Paenibacillus chartarius]|uniref:C40 family peptidase n=1 Tax=Paenibacillus chartarius TaxID=747481 RepID=A0ABV6DG62_9BACL
MRRKSAFIAALVLVILTAMLLPVSAASAASTVSTKLKAKSSVSFRDKPSTSSTVMRYLKIGEIVTALDMPTPSWYQVKDASGVIGYVSSGASYTTVYSNAKTLASTAFRSQPSAASTVIRTLAAGTELDIREKINADWYRAEDVNGASGYVTTSAAVIDANFEVTGVVLPLPERIEAIIAAGQQYMGTPYEFGSTRWNTSTFDCSDFTMTAFWDGARTVLPSDSDSQGDKIRSMGNDVWSWNELKRGDLMFFMSSRSNYSGVDKTTEPITHVGIYLGNGQILHTYSIASGGVRIDTIAGSQWEKRFLFGGSAY